MVVVNELSRTYASRSIPSQAYRQALPVSLDFLQRLGPRPMAIPSDHVRDQNKATSVEACANPILGVLQLKKVMP